MILTKHHLYLCNYNDYDYSKFQITDITINYDILCNNI